MEASLEDDCGAAVAVLLISASPKIGGAVAAGGFGATVTPGRSEPNSLVVLGGI